MILARFTKALTQDPRWPHLAAALTPVLNVFAGETVWFCPPSEDGEIAVLMSDKPADDRPRLYDLNNDTFRPATQDDLDGLIATIRKQRDELRDLKPAT